MTSLPAVRMLACLATVTETMIEHAVELRRQPDVTSVPRSFDIKLVNGGVMAEWFVDAELSNGAALSWRLQLRHGDGEWVIESDLSRVTAEGNDETLDLPTRFALDDDVEAELLGAAKALAASRPPAEDGREADV